MAEFEESSDSNEDTDTENEVDEKDFKLEQDCVNLLVEIQDYCDKYGISELYKHLKTSDIIDFKKSDT
jgi:hypothetical protein